MGHGGILRPWLTGPFFGPVPLKKPLVWTFDSRQFNVSAAMRILPVFAACCLAVSWTLHAEGPLGYYRSPAIHGDTIVFVAEGDLWRTSPAGGVAQRLTTHAGLETLPAISPDGKTVAFAALYEGKSELYTMPLNGGLPVRHTFDNSEPKAVRWSPDGQVLYATDRHSTLPDRQLMRLNPATHERTPVPLAQASDGCYDPTGGTLYFVRLPKQSSATKRYRGGWIENLWSYKNGDPEAVQLEPKDKSTSRSPMWWQDRLYFLSDRDGTMNLWSMKSDGTDPKQHTRHADMDAKSPSLDAGRIVYQKGADLRLYDIAQDKDSAVPVTLATDFEQQREQWIKKPFDFLTSWRPSPNGDRLVLTARGEIFVTTFDPGRLVEVPRQEGVRYRAASFLPDGKNLLLQSDASGEIEFWKTPANGTASPEQITQDGSIFRFGAKTSPDGKWIAYGDKNYKLWICELATKVARVVATSRSDEIQDFEWSPDSQWLAFVDELPNTYRQIKLYHLADSSTVAATSDRTNSFDPAWSPDGKFLYFLSERELRTVVTSPWGMRQPEPFYTDTTKIYLLPLRKGLRSPFLPHDELHPAPSAPDTKAPVPVRKPDEEPKPKPQPAPPPTAQKPGEETRPKVDADKEKDKDKKPDAAPAAPSKRKANEVVIDVDGLMARVEEVPVAAGNYEKLTVGPKYLYFTSKPAGFNTTGSIKHFEISGKVHQPAVLVEGTTSYELASERTKMVVRKGDDFFVIDAASTAPATLSNKAELNGWSFAISPREEWKQIYRESWRMLRDYFYDRNMHGIDWPAMRKKYEPLVDRVTERNELSDILQDMLGELATLHLYVRYGDDRGLPTIIDTAGLGARFARDEAAGGWRVEHLWKTDPDYPNKLPPLAKHGVEVAEGDVITRINGRSTLEVPHPDALLRNQAGKQVLIEVKTGDTKRQVIAKPVTDKIEADLRYDEWEYTRRLKVEELGKGQIGYVHLRAMGEDDMAQWARDFYPVFQRQGLIVDVRHNRGGNIDSWVLEKLLRKAWSYFSRPMGDSHWNMQYAFRGHLVVLCDQKTASDGEGFSEGFRRLGLGKVVGTRTWGGQVWLSASRWLVDSGMATAAEMGVYSPEGQWLIEGEGLHPDIVVDNLPHQTFLGKDTQLEFAVQHLQELIVKDPRLPVPAPKRPVKVYSDDGMKAR